MMTIEHHPDDYLVLRASGKLTKADYDAGVPELENAMRLREGPVRLLILLEDFRGWDIGALWADLRFDAQHHADFERIAIVGDKRWQEWGTAFSKPFFGPKMRYFGQEQRPEAEAWLTRTA